MQRSVIATAVVGWCLFVTSFFLTAYLGTSGQSGHFYGGGGAPPLQGWQAAEIALRGVSWDTEFFLSFPCGLTNFVMLGSPIFFFLQAPFRRRIVVYALLVSSLLDLVPYFFFGSRSRWTVGYFLWCGSFWSRLHFIGRNGPSFLARL